MQAPAKRRLLPKLPLWASHVACLFCPLLLLLFRPLGMNGTQSFLLAVLVLVITWWSTNRVPRLPAACLLLGVFLLVSSTPPATVFSFPLSQTFPLIVVSYLFSRGIENSGLAGRFLEPILSRWANTAAKALVSVILVLYATIYIIPQPLARLIILSTIYRNYLEKTDVPKRTKSLILFSVFAFYLTVNMTILDGDIILNTAAIGFSGLSMGSTEWIRYMALPTLFLVAGTLGLMLLLFRADIRGVRIRLLTNDLPVVPTLSSKERFTIWVIGCTVLLWAVGGLFGEMLPFPLNPLGVAVAGTLLLFAAGTLRLRDLKVIDLTTLVVLTAAFSIGGVLKASGIADIVFTRIAALFPATFSLTYVALVALASMLIHLILGSTSTTLSVIIPGFLVVCNGILPDKATLLLCYTSVATQYILPFHAISMMIGFSDGLFPMRYVTKLGAALMVFVFLCILLVYLPWWRLTGLVT